MSDETTEATQGEKSTSGTSTQESTGSQSTQATLTQTESDWKSGFSEETRNHPSLQKYSNAESLAQGYINASSMLGKDPVVKPTNEDEWNAFYNKMGRPEEATGYKFKDFESPENLKEYMAERIGSFREMSHKLGLTADQAAGLHDWYMESNIKDATEIAETSATSMKDAEDALKKDWGQAYEVKMSIAKSAIAEFGDKEFVEYLNSSGLGNNPSMNRIFNAIGEAMMEDSKLEGLGATNTNTNLQAQVTEIMARPAYWDANSQERPALVRKVSDLMEQIHN